MAKFTFYVSTGLAGSKRKQTINIPDGELEGLSADEKDDYIAKNYFDDWLINNADFGWHQED